MHGDNQQLSLAEQTNKQKNNASHPWSNILPTRHRPPARRVLRVLHADRWLSFHCLEVQEQEAELFWEALENF